MTLDLRSLPPPAMPMALAALHRSIQPGDRRQIRFPASVSVQQRNDLLDGAGLAPLRGVAAAVSTSERFWTLPDTVGPDMRVLVVGLNPSPAAADDGIGFARPGNRFWPAALASGLVTIDRDPDHGLTHHGMGMTDLVKRTTRRASELTTEEYMSGIDRLDRIVRWLRPTAVCFVGLAGWRSARDRRAICGWQPDGLGDRPVYLMPSTSGLNASSQLPDFTAHLRSVQKG